jgi:hypothetical protein
MGWGASMFRIFSGTNGRRRREFRGLSIVVCVARVVLRLSGEGILWRTENENIHQPFAACLNSMNNPLAGMQGDSKHPG